jgi:hypothetical protein
MTPFKQLVEDALGDESIQDAADRIGITRHVIDAIRHKGTVPSGRYFDRLVDGLGIDRTAAALASRGIAPQGAVAG